MGVTETMKAVAGDGTDALITMMSEQCDLYRRLSAYVRRQHGLITGDEPERLLALLAERQEILGRLSAIGERLRPYQRDWPQMRRRLNDDQLRRVDGLVLEMNQLLSHILAADEQDARLLAARRGATAEAMGAVKTNKQAGAAYRASGGGSPSSLEWTDE